jgi:succinate dehydrogenase / fumarate reductase cytochrome b subunit
MSPSPAGFFESSIIRKQIVAVTGIAMVMFILGHLAGNLLILLGPKAFNDYAAMLASIPEVLWVARIGLAISLVLHVYFTIALTIENRAARGGAYAVSSSKGDTGFARKFMIYTGLLLLFVFFFHLRDFTFGDKEGASSVVAGLNGGESLGLFGLVWNSFLFVPRSVIYILFVSSVGLHLSHGVQSLFQTLGINHERWTPLVKKVSVALGLIVAVGFSSIPLFVLIMQTPSI